MSMASMESAVVNERINRCNCNVGGVISITSNSAMRYEGIVESVYLHEQLICLKNVRSFGTEGRRKDSAQVLPDDRVFDNVQFRGCDIKELQVLTSPPSAHVLAVPHDPAIIQCRPLDSAQASGSSCEAEFNLNTGIGFTIEESQPSVSPMHDLTLFSALKLCQNISSDLHGMLSKCQGVSGLLGDVLDKNASLDRPPTLAEYYLNLKQPMQSSGANASWHHAFSSQVSLASSTPIQTISPHLPPKLVSSPLALNAHNLSPDVAPPCVPPENFHNPNLSFGSQATITCKDRNAVSLQTVDGLNSLFSSCLRPQSLSQPMAPKNQISESNRSNEIKPSSQEKPVQVLPAGSLAVTSLQLRDSVPENTEPVKTLFPDSGSTGPRDCSVPIPPMSTHAKTATFGLLLKSAVSQATTLSSPIPSAGKMSKGNVGNNIKVAGKPEKNTSMIRAAKAEGDADQANVNKMKDGWADGLTIQLRQPRKICSFGRTKKVSHFPTNYSEEFNVGSMNGKFNKTGGYDPSSKIEHARLKPKGNTRDINIHNSEKQVQAKDRLSNSLVASKSELTKRNMKISGQQKMGAETYGTTDQKSRINQSSGRFAKFTGSAGGTGRGSAGRSQAESIGKHVT